MGHIATSAAGLRSSRGLPWFGKAGFAFAAFVWAFGFAAWIVDFDPFTLLRGAASAKTASTQSFDDRFGSGAALNPASIYYPSRPVVRSGRSDFESEFEHIENQLAEQSAEPSHDAPAEQPGPAVAAVPLPKSRPVEANLQPRNDLPPAPTAQADNRTVMQKLADLVPMRFSLASLTPSDGLLASKPDLGALGYDNQTAVYDISARAVYMPGGARLEAHSGLGSLMDDPAHVNERNVGATPPSVYDLKPRERLFHGVQALRMIPVDEADTLGRSGLLVHTYMLGPNGDSNGCVSIKNYDKFLTAFKNGEVKRLVVVPSLNEGLSASRRSTSQS
jgi:type VI secretion system (T6SS) effector TldE1-like protein